MSTFEQKVMFPPKGGYVLAVSGGVDSITLLDVFAKVARTKGYTLVVAHFDHGIRKDSKEDCKFVAKLALQYKLPFESKRVELGAKATEATARTERYKFLDLVASKYSATIVTAQHADDLAETIIFNQGRKSAAIPFANKNVLRPFINIYRHEVLSYAKSHKLTWREDSTNTDLHNARNFIRHVLIPYLEKTEPKFKQNLINNVER